MKNISTSYKELRKYFHNTYWIISEKILGIVSAILVSAVVARYLGPEEYGTLSYAISLAAIFSAFGHMGLSGIVVKDIVKNPENRNEIIGTTIAIKFIGMLAAYSILVSYAFYFERSDEVVFPIILISGTIILFQPINTLRLFFESRVEAKYPVISNIGGLSTGIALKLGLVIGGLSLIYFAYVTIIQALATTVFLIFFFTIKSQIALKKLTFSKKKAKILLSQCWIIYIGTIFSVIYLKVDQVMIRWLIDKESVGTYAIASQISEAWYFLPAAIVTTVYPKLINLRETNKSVYYEKIQKLFDYLFIIALVTSAIITLTGESLIILIYGSNYLESANILIIHIWASVFIFMRAVFSKWLIIENLLVFSLITQGLGAISNIFLNLILIPEYGGEGAAIATLFSYSIASYFSLILTKKTRKIFILMTNSYILHIINVGKYMSKLQ